MNRFMISLLVVVAASCGGKTEEAPTAASGSQPAAGSAPAKPEATNAGSAAGSAAAGSAAGSAAAAGSGSAVAAKEPEVPTAEDFEEDATKRITEKNLETEVKLLEKEIGED